MAIEVKHAFHSEKGDGSDATLVRPSNWNANHDIELSTNKIIGRLTAGPGDAEELPVTKFMIDLLNTADFAALAAALGLPTTGDARLTYKQTAIPGWVFANDGSIGDVGSGATTRAEADTFPLFSFFFHTMWEGYAPLQNSAGGATTRAAHGNNSGNAWTAKCRMVLPRALGRAIVVGGAAAGAGLTQRYPGQWDGFETHTLTLAETPAHTHGQQGAHAGSGSGSGSISGSGSGSCSGTSDYMDRGIDHLHKLAVDGHTTGYMNQSNPHNHDIGGGTKVGTTSYGRPQNPVFDGFIPLGVVDISINNRDINHLHGLPNYTGASDRDLNHKHTFSGSASVSVGGSCSVTSISVSTTLSGSTTSQGGNGAHNNMQPWTGLTVMIKL